jgi:hypothetical protein
MTVEANTVMGTMENIARVTDENSAFAEQMNTQLR